MSPVVFLAALSVAFPVQDPVLITRQDTPTREVVIAIPNIACRGRFADSLKEHIVAPHDWIHSFTASYPSPGNQNLMVPEDASTPARLVFTIDSRRTPEQLVRVLVESRYYVTDHWVLIQRRRFTEIK